MYALPTSISRLSGWKICTPQRWNWSTQKGCPQSWLVSLVVKHQTNETKCFGYFERLGSQERLGQTPITLMRKNPSLRDTERQGITAAQACFQPFRWAIASRICIQKGRHPIARVSNDLHQGSLHCSVPRDRMQTWSPNISAWHNCAEHYGWEIEHS